MKTSNNKLSHTERRSRLWGYLVQAIIAALTALSGVFTGCSLAKHHPLFAKTSVTLSSSAVNTVK